jgi:hypothetical protein
MGHSALNACIPMHIHTFYHACVNLGIMCLYIYLIKSTAHLSIFAGEPMPRNITSSELEAQARRGSLHTFTSIAIYIKQTMLILGYRGLLNTEKNARTDAICCEEKHAAVAVQRVCVIVNRLGAMSRGQQLKGRAFTPAPL